MLNEKFDSFIRKTFSSVSYQGNPSSKKLKCNGQVFSTKEAFQHVQDAYKDAIASGREQSTDAVLLKDGSSEATEVLNILLQIAKGNKKAHAQHEEVRRSAEVSGSMGDTLTMMNESPLRPNRMDIEILSNFCITSNDSMMEVYYKYEDVDGRTKLESLGMFNSNMKDLSALANAMAKKHPLDIDNSYDAMTAALSNSYNSMQTMTPDEIKGVLEAKGMDKWPEIKSLYHTDLESVLVALIAHYRANNVPVLPWVLHYVELYRVTSTKTEGETKSSWTSGFKMRTKQGIMLDDVSYYKWALGYTHYIPQIENPQRFGGVFTIEDGKKPYGERLKKWDESPFLKATFYGMSKNQIKAYSAFWYCVANHLQTPSMLHNDQGGNLKNGTVDVIREGLADFWGCDQKDVYFKLERDQLANKDRKYHVKTDGLSKRTLLDYLFVFYDEVSPSREMWEEFKALTGAKKATVNVRPLYGDPYTVTADPVPFYMTRNTRTSFYEKEPMMRRMFVIRTSAKNTYLELLTDEERGLLDDEQMRKDTFATLMHIGKVAYEEIAKLGGMLNINNIYEDIGQVLGSSAGDPDSDFKYYYKSLFEGKNADEERVIVPADELYEGLIKMYPDYEDTDRFPKTGLQMRLSDFVLDVDARNKKDRVRMKNKRPMAYFLYRNEVISNLVDPTEVLKK